MSDSHVAVHGSPGEARTPDPATDASVTAKRVLFFGFSITELTGYVQALESLVVDRDIVLEHRGIGGINLESLPYLQSVLDYECQDHVVFEVTTCRRYAEDNPDAYREAVAEVISQVRAHGAEPAFLHLYREGVDYTDDRMLAGVAALCEEHKVAYLSLVPQMIEYRRAGCLAHFLRDGIHTTPEGAKHYARAVVPFLDMIVNDGREPRVRGEKRTTWQRALIPVDRLVDAGRLSSFSRGNLELPVVEIAAGDACDFDLPDGYAFEGLLYLRTPRAGMLEVRVGDHDVRRCLAFDEHSYYRRYASWTVTSCAVPRVTVTQLAAPLDDIRLVKGERDPGPRVGEVCGVFVRAI